MIRENIEKESRDKSSKKIKIILETPKNSNMNKKGKRVHSQTKPSNHGRNFEGLYFQSSDNYLNSDMHYLYQGGTPINDSRENQNYKPLPLSIAKINFQSEAKPVNYNREYYEAQFRSGPNAFEYETHKPKYGCVL